MKGDALRREPVDRAGLTGEAEMTLVRLDSDQMDVKSERSRRGTGVVHPTPPAASELCHGEGTACEFDRPEGCRPLGDVCVPICRDRHGLDVALPAAKDLRQ